MLPSEHDLEQIDALLDGELGGAEAEALEARVVNEPELSRAYERARRERQARQLAWSALEPRDEEVEALVARVHGDIARDHVWTGRLRALRYVSGLAACVVLGFLVGRYAPYMNGYGTRDNGIVYDPGRGPMQQVKATPQPQQQGFKVLLTDQQGRVIAEQQFSTFDEARRFTDDLSRAAQPGARRRPAPAQPLVNDTFYIKGEF
jgi:hypothetical protein